MAKRNTSGMARKSVGRTGAKAASKSASKPASKAALHSGAKKGARKGATKKVVASKVSKKRTVTGVATSVAKGKPAARGKAAKAARKPSRPAAVAKAGKHTAKKTRTVAGATRGSPTSRGGGSKPERLQRTFAEAIERAMQGYLFDAIALFHDVVRSDRRSEVADDALFNVGACCLQMHLYNDAEKAFTQVLDQYPDATIHAVAGGQEVGRTAAKALLGRYRARRMLKDSAGAAADRDALQGYSDSYVVNPDGKRITFFELAGT